MNRPLSNLKAELARNGISQIELAKGLSMHSNSLSNKLNGCTKFTIEEAFKICDLLNQDDIRYLFAEDAVS